MRPVFGKGNGEGEIITGIETPPQKVTIYPNPATGFFYVSNIVDLVEVIDVTGRKIDIISETLNEQTRITISHNTPGLYLVKIYKYNQWHTFKIVNK